MQAKITRVKSGITRHQLRKKLKYEYYIDKFCEVQYEAFTFVV